jgi:hemerythrin-like domain-containing protein
MRKLDLFTVIHNGMRAAGFRVAAILAATDFTQHGERASAAEEVIRFIDLLREHAQHEDLHVLPALLGIDPGLAHALAREHVELELRARDLQLRLSELERSPTTVSPSTDAPARAVRGALHRLLAGHLLHMDREETEASAALWTKLSDGELAALSQRIFESMPLERTVAWAQLALPTLPLAEQAGVRRALQQSLPADAWQLLVEGLSLTTGGVS